MKRLKQITFLLLILLSCLVMTMIGIKGKNTYYKYYDYSIKDMPYLSIVMKGIFDDVSPLTVLLKPEEEKNVAETTPDTDQDLEDSVTEEEMDTASEDGTEQEQTGQTPEETGNQTTIFEYEIVKDDYFDDALFIGDSRTVGFSLYGGLTNATYFADTGLNIFSVMEKEFLSLENIPGKTTVDVALAQKSFAKIYIMLGINELGRGTTEDFVTKYKEVIDRIHTLQPRAIIYIQSIMHVSGEKAASDPVFNNVNINERNAALATLANNKDIFYLDVNEAVSDTEGNLFKEYSFDGIHLKAEYIGTWKDYLANHAIVTDTMIKACYYWEAPGYVAK